jgi:hypothetical protein
MSAAPRPEPLTSPTSPFSPSLSWFDAFQTQASTPLFERLLRYAEPPHHPACADRAQRRAAEVVLDAVSQALDGRHYWSPAAEPLEAHLRCSLRWRASMDRPYARELASGIYPTSAHPSDDDPTQELLPAPAATPSRLSAHDAAKILHALRRVVRSDAMILELLDDALRHDEALERMSRPSQPDHQALAVELWSSTWTRLAALRSAVAGHAAQPTARDAGPWPEPPRRADLHALLKITPATRGCLLDVRRILAPECW